MGQSTLSFAPRAPEEGGTKVRKSKSVTTLSSDAPEVFSVGSTRATGSAPMPPTTSSASSTSQAKIAKIHPLFAPRMKKASAAASTTASPTAPPDAIGGQRSAVDATYDVEPQKSKALSLSSSSEGSEPAQVVNEVVTINDTDSSDDEVHILADNVGVASRKSMAKRSAPSDAVTQLSLAPAPSIAKKHGPTHSFFQARKMTSSRHDAATYQAAPGILKRLRKPASWPTGENVHVRTPDNRYAASEGFVKDNKGLVRIQNAFLGEDGPIALHSSKGKGRATDQGTLGALDAERQLLSAAVNAPLSGSPPQSVAQIRAELPFPERGDKKNIVCQYLQRDVDLHSVRSADGNLPAAIQRLLDVVHLQEVSDRPAAGAVASHWDLWSDRWRPTRAAEVLGNEDQATYLRDWIWKLKIAPPPPKPPVEEVQKQPGVVGKKRKRPRKDESSRKPRIQKRAIKMRHRRGSDLEDFIIDDDADDVESYDSNSDADEHYFDRFRPKPAVTSEGGDLATGGQGALSDTSFGTHTTGTSIDVNAAPPAAPPPTPSAPTFADATRLTNCIVLAGPVGSGKTAAAFACAAELDHDVFELFPGMGKRSGKDILSAIGNLANNNHMVSKGGQGGGAFFRKNQGPSSPQKRQMPDTAKDEKVHQSVILIDQADILFEEDKGFWHAIIELIGTSARPVILTCNDIAKIPISDLPVQEILYFTAPGLSLGVPYLQLLALSEGHLLPQAEVALLYSSTAESFTGVTDSTAPRLRPGRADGPAHPCFELSTPERAPLYVEDGTELNQIHDTFDLRHGLSTLQFWCQWAVGVQRCPALPDRIGQLDWQSSGASVWSRESLRGSDFESVPGELEVKVEEMEEEQVTLGDLREIASAACAYSFADSALIPSFHRQAWDLELEDQLGISEQQHHDGARELHRLRVEEQSQSLPSVGRESEMQESIFSMASASMRNALPRRPRIAAQLTTHTNQGCIDVERLRNSRLLFTILGHTSLVPLDHALPSPSCATEYWPYIRQMVEMDNAAQKAHDAEIARLMRDDAQDGEAVSHRFRRGPIRATRNSKRSLWDQFRFYRQFDFDDGVLRAVRQFSIQLPAHYVERAEA